MCASVGTSHSAPVEGSCRLRRVGFRDLSCVGLESVGGSGLEWGIVLRCTSGISDEDWSIHWIGAVVGSSYVTIGAVAEAILFLVPIWRWLSLDLD